MPDKAPSILPAAHTAAGLDQALGHLAEAGGWWTAEQKIAIAEEMRAARKCTLCAERKTALSPYSVYNQDHDSATTLSTHTVDVIHRMTTDPGRLNQRWYDEAMAGGMRAEELVEITGVIGALTIADTLSRALSLPERPLPKPIAGEPHRQPVSGTRIDRAWVPMVAPESAEGPLKVVYEQIETAAGFVFNVVRALTAVPEAVNIFFAAFGPNYATHGDVAPGGLDRSQVELLASATSDYNDCFY